MARRRHPLLTPLDLYDRYPSSDLLPIDRPGPLTTWLDIQADIESNDGCGDTLFMFLIYELGEAGLPLTGQIGRLDTAVHDLMSVRLYAESVEEGAV